MSATQVIALVDANERAAAEFCRLLREAGDTSPLTLGGQWTVRDTAVHVLAFSKVYTALLDGQTSPARRIEDFDVLNASFFMVLDETDGRVLADQVNTATAKFRHRAALLTDDDVRPWHLGLDLPAVDHLALMGNELLMHGWDIAAVTGNRSKAGEAATPVLGQLATLWPAFFRNDLGDGVRFGVHVDGLDPLVFVFGDGTLRLEQAPGEDTDCAVTGSAMNQLLWIGGRSSLADAELALSGARPELADSFGFPAAY